MPALRTQSLFWTFPGNPAQRPEFPLSVTDALPGQHTVSGLPPAAKHPCPLVGPTQVTPDLRFKAAGHPWFTHRKLPSCVPDTAVCPRVRPGHSVTTQLPSPRCFEGCLKENTPRVTSVCPEPQPGQLCLWELGRVETAPGLPLTGRTPERPALPPPEAGLLGRRSPSRNPSPRDCMRSPGGLKETMILIIC